MPFNQYLKEIGYMPPRRRAKDADMVSAAAGDPGLELSGRMPKLHQTAIDKYNRQVTSGRSRQDARSEAIADLIAYYDATELNFGDDLHELKESLLRCDEGSFATRIKMTEELFGIKHQAVRRVTNLQRQERELRKAEVGEEVDYTRRLRKIDLKTHTAQHEKAIPMEGEGRRWYSSRDGYHMAPSTGKWSWLGGTKAGYVSIAENGSDTILTGPPDLGYRNMVLDSQARAKDELEVAKKYTETLIKDGRRPTDNEVKSVRRFSKTMNRVSNIGQTAAHGFQKLLHQATAGIVTHRKVVDDSRYQADNKKLNEALSRLIWQISPNPQAAQYLQQQLAHLTSSGDILQDKTLFSRLQNLLNTFAKEEMGAQEKAIDKANNRMQKIHDSLENKMGDFISKEEAMQKFRILHLLLLLSPIGGLTFLGEGFTLFDPIAEIFGPLFDADLTFGESMGEIGNNVPIFGEVFDAVELDVVTEFLMDLPPFGAVGEVVDLVLKSTISQEFFGVVGDGILGSPLTGLAIAGVYSLFRFQNELIHYKDVTEFREKYKKSLEGAVKTTEEEFSGAPLEKRSEDLSAKILDATETSVLEVDTAKYISSLSKEELKAFDDVDIVVKGKKYDLKILKENGGLTDSAVLKLMSDDSKVKDALERHALLHQKVVDANMAQYIAGLSDSELGIFGDFKFDGKQSSLVSLKTEEKDKDDASKTVKILKEEDILAVISASKENRDRIISGLESLGYNLQDEAICQQNVKSLSILRGDSTKAEESVQAALQEKRLQFMEKHASNRGITSNVKDRVKRYQQLRETVISDVAHDIYANTKSSPDPFEGKVGDERKAAIDKLESERRKKEDDVRGATPAPAPIPRTCRDTGRRGFGAMPVGGVAPEIGVTVA